MVLLVPAALVLATALGLVAGVRPSAGPPSSAGGPSAPADAGLVGRPAPALRGATLAGGRLDLADLRGSVVVVDAWAAWCAPCRAELPLLVSARRRLGPRGLRLVGIDVRDGAVQARQLLAATGGDPASSVADPTGQLAASWDVRDVPQTFVVDRAGTVRARHLGPVDAAWLDAAAGPLLGPSGEAPVG